MIEIDKVSKQFQHHIAVDQVSLQVAKGDYLALLGVNGAGKTTLVEMIEGLQLPDSGTIRIQGLSWQQHAKQLRKIVGLSLQETKFIDKLTTLETLRLFASFYYLSEDRVQTVLDWIHLRPKKDTYTAQLSGGQRQRLALGVALLNAPQLLLLDEPTTGLDPNSRRELWELLLQLKQTEQMTLLLTTHYMEEAEKLCDRIVMMDNGKIVADGTLQYLLSQYLEGEVVEFLVNHPFDVNSLVQLNGVLSIHLQSTAKGYAGKITVHHVSQFLPLFFDFLSSHQIQLLEIQAHKKTLDDLFTLITGKKLAPTA